jgi:hypothetical protein
MTSSFDDAVFLSTCHVWLIRIVDSGQQDRMQVPTFIEAMIQADRALTEGYRILVYACNAAGPLGAATASAMESLRHILLRREWDFEPSV